VNGIWLYFTEVQFQKGNIKALAFIYRNKHEINILICVSNRYSVPEYTAVLRVCHTTLFYIRGIIYMHWLFSTKYYTTTNNKAKIHRYIVLRIFCKPAKENVFTFLCTVNGRFRCTGLNLRIAITGAQILGNIGYWGYKSVHDIGICLRVLRFLLNY